MQPLLRLSAALLLALLGTSNLHAQSSSLTVLYHRDASAGVVMADNALMRTTNNGRTWVDISPRLSPSETVAAAYFLDGNTGWSVLSASHAGELASARVVSTGSSGGFLDGRSSPLPIDPQFLQFWSGGAYITFADANHGWVELQRMSSSNFKGGIIFRTENGGRTWAELPAPPTVDNMRFLSNKVGWIAGGPGGDHLYRTADGGQTWTDDRVPQPATATSTQALYSLPQVDASGRLFLAVTFVKVGDVAGPTTLASYTSNDEGATWEPYSVRSGLSDSSRIPTDVTGTSLVAVYSEVEGNTANSAGNEKGARPVTKIQAPSQGAVLSAHFVDSSHGWLVVQKGICDEGGSCEEQTQLLSTPDGGESTQDITPKAASGASGLSGLTIGPRPELVVPTGSLYPGFDLCAAPTIAVMQQWTSSPYKAIGIYMGGGARYCPQPNLTWTWMFKTACQGWKYLPLWAGTQVSAISATPATAYQQGATEAVNAWEVAEAVFGFFDSAVIYYDLEAYASGPANTPKVQQFIQGWVNTLHNFGYEAGIYGSASNGNDFPTSPAADYVWIAKYSTPVNTGVFGLTPMIDGLWNSNQRIHQYDGNVTKTFGGSANLLIDEDTVDAAATILNSALTSFCATSTVPPPPPSCPSGGKASFSQSTDQWSCSGGSGNTCPQYCGSVCITQASCSCADETPSCVENSGGYFWNCNNSCTPVVIDAFQEGFHLTSIDNGVPFRVKAAGPLLQMAWTDANFRNGWLVLDRNHNGLIDDFSELFGNLTPQPSGDHPNGYAALAVFDEPAQGGNGNGFIDAGDAIYDQLKIWIDTNHDGVSQATELHGLAELGIEKIDLTYHLSRYTDAYGNIFRYRDSIVFDPEHLRDHSSYDVLIGVRAEVK